MADRIRAAITNIQNEIKITQVNKSTEYHLGQLRAKLSALTKSLASMAAPTLKRACEKSVKLLNKRRADCKELLTAVDMVMSYGVVEEASGTPAPASTSTLAAFPTADNDISPSGGPGYEFPIQCLATLYITLADADKPACAKISAVAELSAKLDFFLCGDHVERSTPMPIGIPDMTIIVVRYLLLNTNVLLSLLYLLQKYLQLYNNQKLTDDTASGWPCNLMALLQFLRTERDNIIRSLSNDLFLTVTHLFLSPEDGELRNVIVSMTTPVLSRIVDIFFDEKDGPPKIVSHLAVRLSDVRLMLLRSAQPLFALRSIDANYSTNDKLLSLHGVLSSLLTKVRKSKQLEAYASTLEYTLSLWKGKEPHISN